MSETEDETLSRDLSGATTYTASLSAKGCPEQIKKTMIPGGACAVAVPQFGFRRPQNGSPIREEWCG